jgi:hypothetical protein
MRKKKDPEFTLRFTAADVKDIPARLREIAEEVPEDIGVVGIRMGSWLLIHGDGKQR